VPIVKVGMDAKDVSVITIRLSDPPVVTVRLDFFARLFQDFDPCEIILLA